MTLLMNEDLLQQIRVQGESHYPYESAGLILGRACNGMREAIAILPLANRSEERAHRYRFEPQDMLAAELHAERLDLDLVGIFHSHPDFPAEPSQQDLETAYPWFSYVITSIQAGAAYLTRSWRLHGEHSRWTEEAIRLKASDINEGCDKVCSRSTVGE